MAYDATRYQLTQLLQDAWYRMGQLRRWVITGGDTDTIINTSWAGVEEPVFEDDDPALIAGTAIVLETTDGLAPAGEWGEILDYDSSTQSLGIRALSTSVGAGDRIGLASPLFPVEDMIELANIALQRLGQIDIPYTGLSIVANQHDYSLPSYISERPVRVRYRGADQVWKPLDFGWTPQTVGTQWTLYLPTIPTDSTVEVLYRGAHPKLTAFDSEISPSIDPELAISALIAEAFQWYNNALGGANQYFLQRENKAIQDLESAVVRYPVSHVPDQVSGFVHWGSAGEYVPGTSDLRG